MFRLKVEWKKRLLISIINLIPMIALVVALIIISFNKKVVDGVVVAIICSIIYMFGVKDILFFEYNKERRLDYFGEKKQTSWKPSSVAILIRTAIFVILIFYLIIVLLVKKEG